MPVTLGDIHDAVRDALKRGNTLDVVIASRVRQAARWIERNYTFLYMKRFGEVTVDLDSDYPYVLEVPNADWKAIHFLRIRDDEGEFWKLGRIDPAEELDRATERPSGYWLDGVDRIILNQNPDSAYVFEVRWDQYTDWPTTTESSNWLIRNGEDVLIAQAMFLMAPYLRDAKMIQDYVAQRNEGLQTLVHADEESQHSDLSSSMTFVPEGGLQWPQQSS